MAIAFIDSTGVHDGDTDAVATPAMDSSGANLLVCMFWAITGFPVTISDSKGNTWTQPTPVTVLGAYEMSVAYCEGSPTVGSGHTFSMSSIIGVSLLGVIAFSGAKSASSYDTLVAAGTSAGNTLQPGSLTPAENNEVLITYVWGTDSVPTSLAINSSFTEVEDITDTANANNQLGLAYKIQTTGGAENPTWTASGWTGAADMVAHMTAFKAAAAVAAQIPFRNRMQQYLAQ